MKKWLFGRVAGLPARWVDALAESSLVATLDREQAQRELLEAARAACVEEIFVRLKEAEESWRGLLLAIKRDCFNQRSLGSRQERDGFAQCRAWLTTLSAVVELEAELESAQEASARALEQAEARERTLLASAFTDPSFRRGLALASPDLVASWQRLEDPREEVSPRRRRRSEESLLRYLSRTVLKLSPYSTLTRLGLVKVAGEEEVAGEALQFLDGTPQERSLVRVKRYLLDQICDLWKLDPKQRRRLHIERNPCLEILADQEVRYFRTFVLGERNAEGLVTGYLRPASVRLRLTDACLRRALEVLAAGPRIFLELVEQLASEEELTDLGAAAIEESLSIWTGKGLFGLSYPFPGYEPQVESALLEFLAADPGVSRALIGELRGLVAAEQSFHAAEDSLSAVAEIDERVERINRDTRSLLADQVVMDLKKVESRNYYEDVFELRQGGPCARMPAATAARLLAAGSSLWQLTTALEKRSDFLATLAHVFPQRFAGRVKVPLLEVFYGCQDLFKLYLNEVRQKKAGPFDPLQLPEVARLEEQRQRVRAELKAVIAFDGEVEHIDPRRLAALAQSLPEELRTPCGPCLFVQPADAGGRLWVANRIFEGNGRMTSRFNVLLEGELLADYLAECKRASMLFRHGRPVRTLDLLFTRANTVNLHWPQTEVVLLGPGEMVAPEDAQALPLNEIEVHLGPNGFALEARGFEVLPAFLSPLHTAFIPSLLRFVELFGAGSRSDLFFERRVLNRSGARVLPRQQIGDLVVQRRRWVFDRDELPRIQGNRLEDFREAQRFRRRFDLPPQVYVVERLTDGSLAGGVLKPQYVDFRSPGLVEIFLGAVASMGEELSIDEALPRPEDFPLDPRLGRRAIEVMLEA